MEAEEDYVLCFPSNDLRSSSASQDPGPGLDDSDYDLCCTSGSDTADEFVSIGIPGPKSPSNPLPSALVESETFDHNESIESNVSDEEDIGLSLPTSYGQTSSLSIGSVDISDNDDDDEAETDNDSNYGEEEDIGLLVPTAYSVLQKRKRSGDRKEKPDPSFNDVDESDDARRNGRQPGPLVSKRKRTGTSYDRNPSTLMPDPPSQRRARHGRCGRGRR